MTCNCNGNCRRYGSCNGPVQTVTTYSLPAWNVAGHCGKCGAPYTFNPIAGSTAAEFEPSCRCWNR